MVKLFDGNSFSPHELIIAYPIELVGKAVTLDDEVLDAPID